MNMKVIISESLKALMTDCLVQWIAFSFRDHKYVSKAERQAMFEDSSSSSLFTKLISLKPTNLYRQQCHFIVQTHRL